MYICWFLYEYKYCSSVLCAGRRVKAEDEAAGKGIDVIEKY
jgi:hypothetical protein